MGKKAGQQEDAPRRSMRKRAAPSPQPQPPAAPPPSFSSLVIGGPSLPVESGEVRELDFAESSITIQFDSQLTGIVSVTELSCKIGLKHGWEVNSLN